MTALLASDPGMYADYDETGVPIFNADASTPRYPVSCTEHWGTCDLSLNPVPVPTNAQPSPGNDGAMVIIDWATRQSYEFWQARKIPQAWQASWGGVVNIDGAGTPGSAVGAGVSRLAGLILGAEIASGTINHALVFSSRFACSGTFRAPATKTDGGSTDANCLPEGARLQLDPTVNVDAIAGITAGERMVAHALQTYGAFCVDSGSAGMAFAFERVAGNTPYLAAGLAWDYFNMSHIPRSFRVLAG